MKSKAIKSALKSLKGKYVSIEELEMILVDASFEMPIKMTVMKRVVRDLYMLRRNEKVVEP